MNFGQAVEALKRGQKVSREGWNGKGMFLYLEDWKNTDCCELYQPCIVMFTAQKTYQPGWLASQTDILADDWGVV